MIESGEEADEERHLVEVEQAERVLIGLMLLELCAGGALVARLDQIRVVVEVVVAAGALVVGGIEQVELLLLELAQVRELIHGVALAGERDQRASAHAHADEYVREDGEGVDRLLLLDEAVLAELVAVDEAEQDGGELGEEAREEALEQRAELLARRRGEVRGGGGGRERRETVAVLALLLLYLLVEQQLMCAVCVMRLLLTGAVVRRAELGEADATATTVARAATTLLDVVVVHVESEAVVLELELDELAEYEADEEDEYDDDLQRQVGLLDRAHRQVADQRTGI